MPTNEKFTPLTDAEIKQALECCSTANCDICPNLFYGSNPNVDCRSGIISIALDLINRQQAEIESITEKFNCQQTVYADLSKIIKDKNAEIERLKQEKVIACSLIPVRGCSKTETKMKMFEETIKSIEAEAIKEFAEKVTYCKDCAKYELMTSNNQYFCNQFGGYVTETDCCSRGVPCKRNGG